MAQSCPNCGFPIAKPTPLKPSLPAMLWDSEEEGYISVKCPQCSKESRIKETAASKTSTGYKLKGEGKCTCGLVFDSIHRDERIKCPKCGSTEIVVQKGGFDAGSACCSSSNCQYRFARHRAGYRLRFVLL